MAKNMTRSTETLWH